MLKLSMPSRAVLQCGLVAVLSAAVISWCRIRPLGILCLVLFSFWFYKTRCNFQIVPPPEIQSKYERLTGCLINWRQNKPTMFCAISCSCLGALAVIGHLITGSTVVIVGLVLAAIISSKYNFKIIRIEHKDFDWSEKINRDTEVDDEFMPEVNERNLFVLECASDMASISLPTEDNDVGVDNDEDKSDDIPSELLIPDSIPEIDESTDDEELIPIPKMDKKLSETAQKNSDVIEFKKGHFKRDSSLSTTSSSSEESLSKGLQFPDHTTVDGSTIRSLPPPEMSSSSTTVKSSSQSENQEATDLITVAVKSQTQTLLGNSGKLIPSLVSGLVQWSKGGGNDDAGETATTAPKSAPTERRVVTALDSSDESDFEILENEDFK